MSIPLALLLCFLLSVTFVTFLYLPAILIFQITAAFSSSTSSPPASHDRNHPTVIALRFLGVAAACGVAVAVMHSCIELGWLNGCDTSRLSCHSGSEGSPPLPQLLGLTWQNSLPSVLLPLLLTATLFLGPLLSSLLHFRLRLLSAAAGNSSCHVAEPESTTSPLLAAASLGQSEPSTEPAGHGSSFSLPLLMAVVAAVGEKVEGVSLRTARDYLVAPLSEEFVFRGCLTPLLLCCCLPLPAVVLICPLFFGVAHLHHLWQLLQHHQLPLTVALLTVAAQMAYTTVFGWLATFIFLRTGHLISVVVIHSFCNWMGFPDLAELSDHEHRRILIVAYILGLVSFFLLLDPLTSPHLFL